MIKLSSLIASLNSIGLTKEALIIKLSWGSEQEWRNAFKAILAGKEKVIAPTKASMKHFDEAGNSQVYKDILETFQKDEKNKILNMIESSFTNKEDQSPDSSDSYVDSIWKRYREEQEKRRKASEVDPDFADEEAEDDEAFNYDTEKNIDLREQIRSDKTRAKVRVIETKYRSIIEEYIENKRKSQDFISRKVKYDEAINSALIAGKSFYDELSNKIPTHPIPRSLQNQAIKPVEFFILDQSIYVSRFTEDHPMKQLHSYITLTPHERNLGYGGGLSLGPNVIKMLKVYNSDIPQEFYTKEILDVIQAITCTDWSAKISYNLSLEIAAMKDFNRSTGLVLNGYNDEEDSYDPYLQAIDLIMPRPRCAKRARDLFPNQSFGAPIEFDLAFFELYAGLP